MTSTPRKSTSSPTSLSNLLGSKKDEDKKDEKRETEATKTERSDADNEDTSNEESNAGSFQDSVGPDNDKKNVSVEVAPDNDGKNKDEDVVLSRQTVSTVPNKTPADLAAESADETAARYGIDQTSTEEDINNPRVQVYRDTKVNQVPSGTHLHPDIARDLLNRGIAETHTDNAQVTRSKVEYYDFAPDADHNDKF